MPSTRGVGRGSAQDLGVGVGGAALGRVDGGDAGPRLDVHDGDRLAGGQGADVGDLGDDGHLTVTGAEEHSTVTRAASRLDGPAGLVGHEGERDDRPGQDGGRQLGERQPGGGRRGGGDGGRLAHVSKDIDAVSGCLHP